MMLFDIRSLEFSGSTPRCLYEVRRWCGLIGRLSSLQTDIDIMRQWRTGAQMRLESTSEISYMLDEAYSVIADDVRTLTSKPIDLSGIEVWCRLRECAAYVSRIVAYPCVRPMGCSAWEYVSSACALMGVVANVCAGFLPAALFSATSRELSKLWSQVSVDVVCGRGGVWVNFFGDMCRVVGAMAGIDVTAVIDSLAKLRMNGQVAYMSKKLDLDTSATAQHIGSLVLDVASMFDKWQQRCYDESRTENFDYDEATVRVSLNQSVLDLYADVLAPRPDVSCFGGWCRELAFSPVSATSPLCAALDESVSDAYARMRMAQLTLVRLKYI